MARQRKAPTFVGEKVNKMFNLIKQQSVMKKMILTMVMVLMGIDGLFAQQTTVEDKDLIGVWTLEWSQYDGEKKTDISKTKGYIRLKYYGADGEYACAEIVLSIEGKVVVLPHEYGTYTFKDGIYSEMGRPAVNPSDMMLTDKTHFRGRWKNCTEAWVKQPTMPEEVVRFIVERCKLQETPADVQQYIKQNLFE